MKKLIYILFSLVVAKVNGQVVIQMHDTSMSVTVANLPITSCVTNCNALNYQWKNVFGNPVTFALTNTKSTVISGFKAGVSRIALVVNTTTGKTYGDTLTIAFTNPNPVCDSAGIIAAYLKLHPCPICPPPTKQRTANSLTWSPVLQRWIVGYDDGSNPTAL